MGTLNITEIKKTEAQQLGNDYNITLKRDGCLIYYKNKKLVSPRCDRSERYKHILKILNEAEFPNCIGEMYLDEPNSNVFDCSRSENWDKLKFMPFDLLDNNLNLDDRQELLLSLVVKLDNDFITEMINFNSFDEGLNYCLNNNSEGLIFRNDFRWVKYKLLKEEKIEIVAHEIGKDKGTFILKNGSKVSGTSIQYVEQYLDIKSRGNKAEAEIEYPFKTKEGKLFQPRLRLIREIENE